jgi:hypothetical protein
MCYRCRTKKDELVAYILAFPGMDQMDNDQIHDALVRVAEVVTDKALQEQPAVSEIAQRRLVN